MAGGLLQWVQGGLGGNVNEYGTPTIDQSGAMANIQGIGQTGNVNRQNQAYDLTQQMAEGKGPSAAEALLKQQTADTTANINALASSGSGGSGTGLAKRQAMMQAGQAGQSLGGQAAAARAQEQMGAISGMGNLATSSRGQDISQGLGAAGIEGNLAAEQAGLELQTNALNERAEEANQKSASNLLNSVAGAAAGALTVGAMASSPQAKTNLQEVDGLSSSPQDKTNKELAEHPFVTSTRQKFSGLYKEPPTAGLVREMGDYYSAGRSPSGAVEKDTDNVSRRYYQNEGAMGTGQAYGVPPEPQKGERVFDPSKWDAYEALKPGIKTNPMTGMPEESADMGLEEVSKQAEKEKFRLSDKDMRSVSKAPINELPPNLRLAFYEHILGTPGRYDNMPQSQPQDDSLMRAMQESVSSPPDAKDNILDGGDSSSASPGTNDVSSSELIDPSAEDASLNPDPAYKGEYDEAFGSGKPHYDGDSPISGDTAGGGTPWTKVLGAGLAGFATQGKSAGRQLEAMASNKGATEGAATKGAATQGAIATAAGKPVSKSVMGQNTPTDPNDPNQAPAAETAQLPSHVVDYLKQFGYSSPPQAKTNITPASKTQPTKSPKKDVVAEARAKSEEIDPSLLHRKGEKPGVDRGAVATPEGMEIFTGPTGRTLHPKSEEYYSPDQRDIMGQGITESIPTEIEREKSRSVFEGRPSVDTIYQEIARNPERAGLFFPPSYAEKYNEALSPKPTPGPMRDMVGKQSRLDELKAGLAGDDTAQTSGPRNADTANRIVESLLEGGHNPYTAKTTTDLPDPSTVSSPPKAKMEIKSGSIGSALRGLHPYSYNYKSPLNEPIPNPTGKERFFGVMTTDLKKNPTTKNMVSGSGAGERVAIPAATSFNMASSAHLQHASDDHEKRLGALEAVMRRGAAKKGGRYARR